LEINKFKKKMFDWWKSIDFESIKIMIIGISIYNILKYFLKNILKKNKKSDLSIVEGVNKLLEERKRNSEEFKKKYESQISQGLKEIIKDLSLEQLRDKYDKDLL
jgi:hypothetical protein